MMTHDELIPCYEKLQAEGYGQLPMDYTRAEHIYKYISENVPTGSKVLDASCGRGHLMQLLVQGDYDATGTEASRWLIDNVLTPYTVYELRYSELSSLEEKFDVVVSNDVLEHLLTEEEAVTAMEDLCALSRKWFCFAIACHPATRMIDDKQVPLHNLIRPIDWWLVHIKKLCHIEEQHKLGNTNMIYGTVK